MQRGKVDDVEILSKEPISNSMYIKPWRVNYIQAGKKKIWDYMINHDSVAICIYNKSSQNFVMVKQFRPAVYMADVNRNEKNGVAEKVPFSSGITLELCAGIIDRDESPDKIAQSEVLEETGFKIDLENLELICKFRTAVGTGGAIQWLYYTEVDDSMKVTEGGGSEFEGELIDLHYLKLEDVDAFINDKDCAHITSGVMYALSWFLRKKIDKK
uniref:Uridine diphosphate glucose pyrophosphatase NUDT14 n=1 Tax=Phallusia mammillata TaxID=59560 RepID=A0A6F9DND3_9ASCI|nr:uridine diphosphate glucose pyrophosphatase-like [Phallusia mammillata]